MIKPLTLVLSLTTICYGTGLSADVHQVTFVDGGFFPEITHVAPGDTVVFTNDLDSTATVQAVDLSWSSGTLGIGNTFELAVTDETAVIFAQASDPARAGALSFDPAPLDDVSAAAVESPQIVESN